MRLHAYALPATQLLRRLKVLLRDIGFTSTPRTLMAIAKQCATYRSESYFQGRRKNLWIGKTNNIDRHRYVGLFRVKLLPRNRGRNAS